MQVNISNIPQYKNLEDQHLKVFRFWDPSNGDGWTPKSVINLPHLGMFMRLISHINQVVTNTSSALSKKVTF